MRWFFGANPLPLRRAGRPAPAKPPQGRNAARICGRSGVFGTLFKRANKRWYEEAIFFALFQRRLFARFFFEELKIRVFD